MSADISALERGFVEWVNTFTNLSRPCSGLADIADGVILAEILAEIDPQWFSTARQADVGENWVLKFNNLKRLSKLLFRYCEEVLKGSPGALDSPNLSAIAKDNDKQEILKLCQLVLLMAVNCESNQVYIAKIQSLTESSQHCMMVSIEQVSSRLGQVDQEKYAFTDEDHVQQVQNKHAQVVAEKEELEKAHAGLGQDFEQLQNSYQDALSEKNELKNRLKELESSMSNHTGKADFLLKSEIDRLKLDLERSESNRHEMDQIMEQQALTVAELNRKVEDLSKRAEEGGRLKDELDEYKHAADRLQKTEGVIEKYKKKLEESADLRRQIKTLEDQNHELSQRNQQVEDEYRKVAAFKSAMDSYKDDVARLEAKKNELAVENQRLEIEFKKAADKLAKAELDSGRDQEEIHALEEKLREMELHGGAHSPNHSKMESLTDALSGESKAELKQKISRLERELSALSSQSTDGANAGTSQIIILESKLDDVNKAKSKLEADYLAAHKQNLNLKDQIEEMKKQVPKSQEADVARIEKEYVGKLSSQLEQLNNLRIEKDVLQKQITDVKDDLIARERAFNEINSKYTALESKGSSQASEALAEEVQQLHQKIGQMIEQNASLQAKIHKAKEFIKHQDETIKQLRALQHKENFEEAVRSLEVELRNRDELNEKLKKQMLEERTQNKQEMQLMLSAWSNLGRRMQRDNTSTGFANSRGSPTSWLGQQRKAMDNQLKRR